MCHAGTRSVLTTLVDPRVCFGQKGPTLIPTEESSGFQRKEEL